MLILYSCCHGPEIKDRTDSTIIAHVQAGELKGLGLCDVDGPYHVREYDGKEIVYLGPEPEKAKVVFKGEQEMSAQEYCELSNALK